MSKTYRRMNYANEINITPEQLYGERELVKEGTKVIRLKHYKVKDESKKWRKSNETFTISYEDCPNYTYVYNTSEKTLLKNLNRVHSDAYGIARPGSDMRKVYKKREKSLSKREIRSCLSNFDYEPTFLSIGEFPVSNEI